MSERRPGTADLINAVQVSRAPITVGAGSHAPQAGPRKACLVANSALDFGNKRDEEGRPTGRPAVQLGLTRLNSDVRKIPINWFSYKNDQESDSEAEPTDSALGSFSWTAATLIGPRLLHNAKLAEIRALARHPFTSFIEPDKLDRVDALNILCDSPAKGKLSSFYEVNCANHKLTDSDRVLLRRMTVIGEDIPGRDQHRLLSGDVPGLYLQVNYIESLLDDRYLKPLGPAWDVAIFATWLVFLYLVSWIQPEVALSFQLQWECSLNT